MCAITVVGLALAPVKAMRLQPVDAIDLDEHGASGNRSFYVIDERGEMINGKRLGGLQAIVPDYDRERGELGLTFPDGREVRAPVRHGETLPTRFFSHPRPARPLDGPWSDALSDHFGRRLRLVDGGSAVDRGRQAAVSLISRESLERLAGVAERDTVDGRRFRMLIEVAGVQPHQEDRWVGRRVRIGAALVAMHGHVGRCMVTTRNPETGDVDLRTLHALAAYRREEESTEPLPFGVYGEVLSGGRVGLGDVVVPDE
ncbi:MAG TPA: MOSC N-terminal beta barrel domain-containing protein [Solirubrobacteraceae bacterium]|nr:MOSC N-terminal beta barrel domain-containing protein [Solirubrobacteraceae bacterium]